MFTATWLKLLLCQPNDLDRRAAARKRVSYTSFKNNERRGSPGASDVESSSVRTPIVSIHVSASRTKSFMSIGPDQPGGPPAVPWCLARETSRIGVKAI